MPCTIEPWEADISDRDRNETMFGVRDSTAGMLTRFLCELLTKRDDGKPLTVSKECERWWLHHKEVDLAAGRRHK